MNEKTSKIFPEREFYSGFEAKDFSNKFSVGVNCNFYFEDNEAELLMYVSSQKLDNDIKEFYANEDETLSLSFAEKFLNFIVKYGKYLEDWPLLFLGPMMIIFVLSNISNRLSSMKSDMRQRGSLSDGNLAIISITVYVALFLSFIFLPIFVPGIFFRSNDRGRTF